MCGPAGIVGSSSGGAQPMLAPDGEIGVVFNGAIYNFRRLRDELASVGCTFRSLLSMLQRNAWLRSLVLTQMGGEVIMLKRHT